MAIAGPNTQVGAHNKERPHRSTTLPNANTRRIHAPLAWCWVACWGTQTFHPRATMIFRSYGRNCRGNFTAGCKPTAAASSWTLTTWT
eukprot:8296526-Prorocentrum_lima.AAC.1